MPAGSSNTGRNTPNTPGSKIDGEESTGTPIASGTGDPARAIIRIRRHRMHHEKTKAPQPIIHNATRIGATGIGGFDACGMATDTGGSSATKGSFICSTITGTRAGAGMTTECRPTTPPASISSENGTRNLADAASHRQ